MALTSIEELMSPVRLILLFALVAVGVSAPAAAHAPDLHKLTPPAEPDRKAEITAFTLRYRQALEKLDLAAFKAVHHPKVLIFESGHKNVGWDDYEKNHLKPELDAFKAFRFTRWEDSSQVYDSDTALVVAEVAYAIDTKDAKHHEANGVVTLLLRRTKDAWLVVHSHWSTARPKNDGAAP